MKRKKLQVLKFDYAWVIVAISFLSICISLGFCSSGRSMYLTAITEALNIKRSAFSLNDTFRYVTTAVVNLFFGTLISKYGAKKLLCAGYVSLIGFSLINSFTEHLYGFYIAGILFGIGLSWTSTTMVSAVINRWCTKNKGAITGAVLAANGLGGAVAVQIISPIIFEAGNPFGYRNSYRLVALLLVITLAIIVVFFRDNPKNAEKTDCNTPKKRKVRGTGWIGMEFNEATKKPYFYLALICILLTGMSLQGLGGISIPHMYDTGLDKHYVANLSTISSLCLMGSKILTGYTYDRKGMRATMNIAYACAFLALSALALVSNTPLGRVIAGFSVVFNAVALPLETVMLPFFISELFGNKSFEKILGLFAAANYTGYALGTPLANLSYDLFGNYNVSFIAFAALMLFVTITMQFVLQKANRDKKMILAEAEKNETVALQES